MIVWLRRRSNGSERMDASGLAAEPLEAALERVSGVTRRMGGLAAVRRAMTTRVRTNPGATLLDVGTGNLAIPRALRRHLGPSMGLAVGVDLHADVVNVASRISARIPDVAVIRADARALPFPDRSFDVVSSTLTLHHLDDAGATRMLREMGRVAKHSVLVWDLERALHSLLGAAVLARTLWRRDPFVRHDAPLSVRRSYRKAELVRLARAAGLSRPVARRSGLGHLLLTAGPTGERTVPDPPRDPSPSAAAGPGGAR